MSAQYGEPVHGALWSYDSSMRSRSRRVWLTATLVALALLASACGGAGEPTFTAPVTTGANTAAPESAADLRSLTIDVRRDPG